MQKQKPKENLRRYLKPVGVFISALILSEGILMNHTTLKGKETVPIVRVDKKANVEKIASQVIVRINTLKTYEQGKTFLDKIKEPIHSIIKNKRPDLIEKIMIAYYTKTIGDSGKKGKLGGVNTYHTYIDGMFMDLLNSKKIDNKKAISVLVLLSSNYDTCEELLSVSNSRDHLESLEKKVKEGKASVDEQSSYNYYVFFYRAGSGGYIGTHAECVFSLIKEKNESSKVSSIIEYMKKNNWGRYAIKNDFGKLSVKPKWMSGFFSSLY